MGECFDLAFFLEKNRAKTDQAKYKIMEILGLAEGKNRFSEHPYTLLANREIGFFDGEFDDDDYVLYMIAVSEFHITKKSFEERMNQLLQVADACLSQVDAILFATGIYEVIYCQIEGITKIKDIDAKVLSKFPVLFFRTGDEQGFQTSYTHNNTSCVINSGESVQDIFANPITELMEDEGLSFDEAMTKLGW